MSLFDYLAGFRGDIGTDTTHPDHRKGKQQRLRENADPETFAWNFLAMIVLFCVCVGALFLYFGIVMALHSLSDVLYVLVQWLHPLYLYAVPLLVAALGVWEGRRTAAFARRLAYLPRDVATPPSPPSLKVSGAILASIAFLGLWGAVNVDPALQDQDYSGIELSLTGMYLIILLLPLRQMLQPALLRQAAFNPPRAAFKIAIGDATFLLAMWLFGMWCALPTVMDGFVALAAAATFGPAFHYGLRGGLPKGGPSVQRDIERVLPRGLDRRMATSWALAMLPLAVILPTLAILLGF